MGPLAQEAFSVLKEKAGGDRSVFARVTRATVANARMAGVRVDRSALRRLLEQDRLLEALAIRDFAQLDDILGSLAQSPSGWTIDQIRTATSLQGTGSVPRRTARRMR
jgi:hypothetical protein